MAGVTGREVAGAAGSGSVGLCMKGELLPVSELAPFWGSSLLPAGPVPEMSKHHKTEKRQNVSNTGRRTLLCSGAMLSSRAFNAAGHSLVLAVPSPWAQRVLHLLGSPPQGLALSGPLLPLLCTGQPPGGTHKLLGPHGNLFLAPHRDVQLPTLLSPCPAPKRFHTGFSCGFCV